MTARGDREALREALEPTLGVAPTALLMEHLPPMTPELATREDLLGTEERARARSQALEQRVDAKLDGLEQRMDAKLETLEHRLLAAFRLELNQAVTAQTRTVVFSTLGAIVALGGLAITLAALG